jgi:lysozyme
MINLIAMPKTISSRTSAYIPLGGGPPLLSWQPCYMSVFYHRQASAQDYPVQGFDLSHHQGIFNGQKFL